LKTKGGEERKEGRKEERKKESNFLLKNERKASFS